MTARAASKGRPRVRRKWVASVHTDSTHPPQGLFTRKAAAIAKSLASRKVSPKGPASGMRMLNYFINRAGCTLSKERQTELVKAKHILSTYIQREKELTTSNRGKRSKRGRT